MALLAPVAVATGAADASGAQRLDRIQVTATRRAESILEVPPAITVVDADSVAKRSALTVVDLLRGEPGTFVQQTTPGQGTVIIRGLKGSEVLHLVDGFRLNNAFFRNAPNQYLALVDPLAIDSIEAVRGPMSTLYGSDAMGGVVQFLTESPRFEGADWQQQGRVRLQAGSADAARQGRLRYAVGRENLSASVGYSEQKVERRRVGGGERLAFTGFEQRAADFKLEQRSGAHRLSLALQHSLQPQTPRHDALVAGFGQSQPESAELLFKPQARRFTQLRYGFDSPTALADHVELQWGLQRVADDRVSRDFGSVNRDSERNSSRLQGLGGQFEKSVGELHHLSYGFEWYSDRIRSDRVRENISTGALSPRASRYPDGSSARSWALYLADDFRPVPRLDLNFGLRYSRFDVQLPATATGPALRIQPDDVSGHLGSAFELAPGLRLVANAGRGFRAPNVFDLGLLGERPGNRFNVPNQALGPERVHTFDLGVKLARGDWQAEALVFRSDYRDKISSVLTGERTDSGREVVQSQNITRLRLFGFESGLRYQPVGAFSAYATATWTRGEEQLESGQTPADRIPPLFGKLGGLWQIDARWSLDAWGLYATRQNRLSPRDRADPRIDPQGTAAWATVNLRLGFEPSETLSLALSLQNLGDRRYREHGSGLDAPGRDLGLSMDWSF